MFHEAENAVKAGLNDAEFRSLLQEKSFLLVDNGQDAIELEEAVATQHSATKVTDELVSNVKVEESDLFMFDEKYDAPGTMTLRANIAWNLETNYQSELVRVINAKVKVVNSSLTVYVLDSCLHVGYDGDLKWTKEGNRAVVSSRGNPSYNSGKYIKTFSSPLSAAIQSLRSRRCIAICNKDGISMRFLMANQINLCLLLGDSQQL